MQKNSTIPPALWLPILVSAIAIIVILIGDSATTPLRYDRFALINGEWWRLITAHFVHLGWSHLVLNLAGMALIFYFFWTALALHQWVLVLLWSCLGVGVLIYRLDSDVIWYVGLSGVLHGLFIAGGLAAFKTKKWESAFLVSLMVVKLIWEQVYGPMPGSEQSAGGPVLVNAHFYGGIAGALYYIVFLSCNIIRRATN